MENLLTITLLSALVGAVLVLLVGRTPNLARWIALIASLAPLALSTYALAMVYLGTAPAGYGCGAEVTGAGYAFHECHEWIPSLGIRIIFGLDGISAPMFWLTSLLVTLGILFAWDETRRPNQFFGMLLAINVAVMGVFVALDMFLFYVFWELTLIPMAFLIGIWGGPRKRYAAVKFFVYTFAASLVMLLGFMYLYFTAAKGLDFSFEAVQRGAGNVTLEAQRWVFLALFVGFATKFPVVPLHTWLPDAHVEAPTAGSVILAGILLKLGAYGLIRIALPFVPQGAEWAVPLMFVIAVLSMLYASIICLAQTDYKKMVAYSSIGTMGLVLLGIAASVQTHHPLGLVGANFMMLAHGFISPALFMLCGVLQHNLGTREIPLMGGLADKLPRTSFWMVTFSMAGLGLPGLAAFVAEFQVYAAAWQAFGWLVFIAMLYLIFSAAYYLWAAQRAFFGPFTAHPSVDYHHVYDTKWFELAALGALFALTLVFGLMPWLLTDILETPVTTLLAALGGA